MSDMFLFEQSLKGEVARLLALPHDRLMAYVDTGDQDAGSAATSAVGVLLDHGGRFVRFVRMNRSSNTFVPALSEFSPKDDEWSRCEVVGWFLGEVSEMDYGAAAESLGLSLPERIEDISEKDGARIRSLLATWTLENLGANAFRRVDGGRFDFLELAEDQAQEDERPVL